MKYRDQLPQLGGDLFLTDGGIETVLIFHDGVDLPAFAAFDLLKDEQGTEQLRRYYEPYVALARERGVGFVLESPTWRASPRWSEELGYDLEQLDALNRKAIALLEEIRDEQDPSGPPVVISGCIGPHDDGYNPSELLSAEAAQQYHSTQIGTFADTAADMVTAITMTYADEAIGIARAAAAAGIPSAISFTVETDGRLPSGQALGEAIEQVDRETGEGPSYYMIKLRPPDALRVGARARKRMAGAGRGPARECVHPKPRGARRGGGARRG
jgi:S-methylmethionine-dependent homocysteine/selenocysteine methylase